MSTRLVNVVFDSNDMPRLARFWAEALGWRLFDEHPDEIGVAPTVQREFELVFVPVSETKTAKNRIHLDLASTSAEHQSETVERLIGLGASHADIGQGQTPWVVMADPEGNEFCVLEPREMFMTSGRLAAIVVDAASPSQLAPFWEQATGWPIINDKPWGTVQRALTGGPTLDFLRNDEPKVAKNRLHIDVAPPKDGDQLEEVELLIALGAGRIDIGQGDVGWIVLADPEGNEFCVLTPR